VALVGAGAKEAGEPLQGVQDWIRGDELEEVPPQAKVTGDPEECESGVIVEQDLMLEIADDHPIV
jgi:hypothetical protein